MRTQNNPLGKISANMLLSGIKHDVGCGCGAHVEINVQGTVTGRISSNGINNSNTPKHSSYKKTPRLPHPFEVYNIQSEKLMQAVRDIPKGTYAAGAAWVAFMRFERKFSGRRENDRIIFADMMRRHLKWPMSMRVMVKTPEGYLEGKINGHLRDRQHSCYVDFTPNLVNFDGYGKRVSAIVPFRNIKKLNPK